MTLRSRFYQQTWNFTTITHLQHIEAYLDSISGTEALEDPAIFAEHLLEEEGPAFEELTKFFATEGPGFLSPVDWFCGYCDNYFAQCYNAIDTSSPIGVPSTTSPPASSPVASVPCIRLNASDVEQNGLQPIITSLDIQLPAQAVLWYHGAALRSADRILAQGIQCDEGRKNLESGRSRGFYLGEDFQTAVTWAKKKAGTSDAAVVLLFAVDEHHIQTNYTCIDLRDYSTNPPNQQLWVGVVHNSRRGQRSAADGQDIICGPIAKVPRPLPLIWIPKPRQPIVMQNAVKSQTLADAFNGYLVGVLVIV